MEFRTLRADEIECRISSINENKRGVSCSLLLYKDARCDMRILDETVGVMNWQRSHLRDNANCIISIWDDEKKQWISKEDTGTESYTEREKGLASDSFKRAGFNWGIGRELYSAPNIKVQLKEEEISEKNGKKTTYAKFSVAEISYDTRRNIKHLVLIDNKGYERFKWDLKNPSVICCEACGKEIKEKRMKNGKIFSADEIAKNTFEKYGSMLCWECAEQVSEKVKKDGENQE